MSRTTTSSEGVFVIAEAGVNHNGDLDTAFRLVEVAADAGADAVKFQTFDADKLVSAEAPKAEYQRKTTDEGESQYDMLSRLQLSVEDHERLLSHCLDHDIAFMSTPFDRGSADFLYELGVEIFKTSSGDLTDLPLLAHIAKKGRPMIVSTGMAWLGEVEDAVRTLDDAGDVDLTLLHCVSQYPAPVDEVNLRAMQTLESAFGCAVGYSDHTLGIEVPIAAVALGAQVIEKHFTLDRTLPGPDHQASLEPDDLAAMVEGIRSVESALGDGRKRPAPSEADTAGVARKSIVAAHDIAEGGIIDKGALEMRRPGTGLAPKMASVITGRRATRDIAEGTVLTLEMVR